MDFAICIIAKDEQNTISDLIAQLSRQTLLRQERFGKLYVVCNGCSDRTAKTARDAIAKVDFPPQIATQVDDYAEGGKARFWNVAVHQIIDQEAKIAIFIDADVELMDDGVLQDLVEELERQDRAVAISGWPVKDIEKKKRKSTLDRFSLQVSSKTTFEHAINGSLYAAYVRELRRIWLPVPIPGEDGMLTAMIHTHGFSQAAQVERVTRMTRPTHYFEAHSVSGFFQHERRMAVGTAINGWLCEHFWSRRNKLHVGNSIRELNERNPRWVDELVRKNVGQKLWALPTRLLVWRLYNLRGIGILAFCGRLPFSVAATVLNLVPCILANRTLRQRAAATYW